MIELLRDICERKRGRIDPVGATTRELERELALRGVTYTAEEFQRMCAKLEEDPNVRKYRTLNDIAYAYITETDEESLSTEARNPWSPKIRKYRLLSKLAMAEGEDKLPGGASAMCGVPESWEDNPSESGGSHHADQFWWSEI